jgi:glycosyltransferase involved in cell wall biosynthesis
MENTWPLITVCIPVYNNEGTLENTLRSILAQDYPNLEVVIVDDKSSDFSVKLVKGFEDLRIRLVKNGQNLGMTKNWNKCLSLANGELVKLICADDILEPSCLRKEAEGFLRHPKLSMVVSHTMLVTERGEFVNLIKRWFRPGLNLGRSMAKTSLILNNFFGAPCNVTFSNSKVKKFGGFDENFALIPDFDLWIRLASAGDVFVIDEPLSSFKIRPGSNTWEIIKDKRARQKYLLEHKRLLKKHRNAFGLSLFHMGLSIASRMLRTLLISKRFSYLLRKG